MMNPFISSSTELLILLTGIAALTWLIQLILHAIFYGNILKQNKSDCSNDIHYTETLPPLSIIIYAKNQKDVLEQNLPSILQQDYPNFEVIVVNDSTDGSDDLLILLAERYKNLYHTFIPNTSRYISQKKLGLTLGIKASKYDWILFTEADCHPVSNQWLQKMARNCTPRTDVVLGYYGYGKSKGLRQKEIAFYNLYTSVRYLGLALAGSPYRGVGRNLLYRKELFFKNKGFSSQLNLQRGEDDLFINEVSTRWNTRVETSPHSIIHRTYPNRNEWISEQMNYLAVIRYLRGYQPALLAFETYTRFFVHLNLASLLVTSILTAQWIWLCGCLIFMTIRTTECLVYINKVCRSLGEPERFYLSLPLLDVLQPWHALSNRLRFLLHSKKDYNRKWIG